MKILFLCVANSARSQMAEGLAKKILQNSAEIQSAGSQPSGVINPYAIETMKEIGININSHHSKSWQDLPKEFLNNLDYIITLCAEESCPLIPTKAKKLHWGMPDPANIVSSNPNDSLLAFRNTRDQIMQKIQSFAEGLV